MAAAVLVLPTVPLMWLDESHGEAIALAVCVAIAFLNGFFYFPWMMRRVVRKRGVSRAE